MKRILFIEDESALQRAASKVLTQEGYEILSALDGETGLALARKEKPDLVLLDLILPRKNGFEVLQEIKSDPEIKSIPIIILSNLEGSADVEKALQLSATTYLTKTNYNLEEVVQKIKELLDNPTK